ncbi:E3 ubiquitin/ISG15 ligase TRIM25-like [Heterodontus francisci]|uniref:E3 ubiquitin/ISG15 ligase TRIM25-like n=1 Tax=Heterodontus francisci TaxID=7792 RepID=UPI00355AE345
MDPGDLEDELTCAVCLHVYQDPVALPCQHSFCLKCIEGVWAQTTGPGGFECPQCHQKFNPRPRLERNFTLCNIVEKYNRSQPPADSARVVCDYCDDNPNPAVKTCLNCETSFCSLHLKPHLQNKTLNGHTLMEPLLDLTDRQCLDHKKVLEVYCKDDEECLCGSCIITGKHKSHTLLSLDQAQAVIKEQLEREVKNLWGVQQNCSRKERDLGSSEAEIMTRINELKGKLSKSFSEWRRQLEEDEEYTLKLIDEEGLRTLSQIRNCSEALNKRMEQITLIDGEIQSLVQRDPLSFIQNWKQLLSRVTETQRVTDPDVPALTLNLSNISQLIQKRLNGCEKYHSDILGIIMSASTEYRGHSNIIPAPHSSSGSAPIPGNVLQPSTGISRRARISQGKSLLSLDPKTANWNLILSDDLRSVTWTRQKQPYPHHPERFKHDPQVLCSQSFCSGFHSWDVETDGKCWGIGIVCGSVEREGIKSNIERNYKSWCLYFSTVYSIDFLIALHNSRRTDLPQIPSKSRIQVQLDYEAGIVSFYQVTDSLTYLHTFQTRFTEPVFPAFYCGNKSSLKLLN